MGRAYRRVPRTENRSRLTADIGEFVRLFRSMVDPYRPELHYMRGPGPKWHAKHTPATEAPAHPAHPALARIQG